MSQIISNPCNSCDCDTTEKQKQVTCSICHNHYHFKKACLRLDDLSDGLLNFACFQCNETSFPFANVCDSGFQSINGLNNDLPIKESQWFEILHLTHASLKRKNRKTS